MRFKPPRARSCARSARRAGFWLLAAVALAAGAQAQTPQHAAVIAASAAAPAATLSSSSAPQVDPAFSIDWHVITNVGLLHARSACFDVSGTAGQAVPGYSSGGDYAVISGFWTVTLTGARDEIFFNGFEGCGP